MFWCDEDVMESLNFGGGASKHTPSTFSLPSHAFDLPKFNPAAAQMGE